MRDIDPAHMAAWRAFLGSHAAVTRVLAEELQSQAGLPLSWYDVLVTLEEAPEQQLRMSELAERVVLSQSGLTRLVDRMQQAGLIERTECPTDGRGRFAAITADGLRALHAAAPTHVEGVWRHFTSQLSERDARTLARSLQRIHDAARAQQPSVQPSP